MTRGAFEQTVSDDGQTRVRDRYVVSAPLAGRLERITLRAGDRGRQGPGRRAAHAHRAGIPRRAHRARAARAHRRGAGASSRAPGRRRSSAPAQRDQAQADLERQARLAKEGFVSETAREQASSRCASPSATLERARFAEDAARHELAQARAALARYESGEPARKWEVTSPVAGAVLKVVQESEGAVALGAPLVELADPHGLEAVVDVLSQEAVGIRPGMPARIELGQGVAPLAARVRLVEPAAFTKVSALGVEEQRVNVVLDFVEPLDAAAPSATAFASRRTLVFRQEQRAEGAGGRALPRRRAAGRSSSWTTSARASAPSR